MKRLKSEEKRQRKPTGAFRTEKQLRAERRRKETGRREPTKTLPHGEGPQRQEWSKRQGTETVIL